MTNIMNCEIQLSVDDEITLEGLATVLLELGVCGLLELSAGGLRLGFDVDLLADRLFHVTLYPLR